MTLQQPILTSRAKNWSDLSHKEFADIYPVVEANAQRHFRCADVLAGAGEHQNAIAHLILGTEELIKTFGTILAAKQTGVKQQSWFGKLFYHHKTRHDLIKDFFSIYMLFRLPDMISSQKGFWAKLGHGILHATTAAGNFFWWKEADDLKQRAFYVDYLGKVIDPADITVDDYQKASRYVQLFKKEIGDLMREIASASPKELAILFEDLDFAKIDQLRKDAYDLEKKVRQQESKLNN
jgi:AbiV family abortive infection protein